MAAIDSVNEDPQNLVQETNEESTTNDASRAGDGNDGSVHSGDKVEENTAVRIEVDVFVSQNNCDGDSSDVGVFSDIDCNEDAADASSFNEDKAGNCCNKQ